MNKTKITEIINLLKAASDEDNAYIGFFLENEPHSESGKESTFSANKDGLLLFAQILISNAIELESMNETDSISLIDNFPNWLDKNSDIHFEHLQKSNRISEEGVNYQPVTLKNKISGYLLLSLITILIIMMVYGFATFVSLFFK